MKCENSCGTDLSGRQQRFCSDKCRKQSLRAATKRNSDKLGRSNSDKVELGQKSNKIPTDAEMDSLCASGEITYIKGKPLNFGQGDCECKHCQYNRTYGNKFTLNHGKWKNVSGLGRNELNRVSLPGDIDYVGVAV